MAERVAQAMPMEVEAREELPERLPVPVAAMIIVLLSAGLWAGIFWAVRAVLA